MQYWVGYTSDKKVKRVLTLLYPDWIRDAYFLDDKDDEIKIFKQGFINEFMVNKKNTAYLINSRTKNIPSENGF